MQERQTNRREELAWAAGFFDGEGCVSNSRTTNGKILRLIVTQTNLATLERFRNAVFGLGRIGGPRQVKNYKPCWNWNADGFYTAQAVMGLLWTFCSDQKREQYKKCLAATTVFGLKQKYRIQCPKGHLYTKENTNMKGKYRSCLTCSRLRTEKFNKEVSERRKNARITTTTQ